MAETDGSTATIGDTQAASTKEHFAVAVVERSPTPDQASGGDWCRYVIANKGTRVVGFRAGSPQEVMAHAQEIAGQLNERLFGPAPTGPSAWSTRHKS